MCPDDFQPPAAELQQNLKSAAFSHTVGLL